MHRESRATRILLAVPLSVRYFFDTEFSERGHEHPIELISIGIVAQDGRELYAVSSEFDADACNTWVKEHVLLQLQLSGEEMKRPQLCGSSYPMSTRYISSLVREFIHDENPEFWAYYGSYDWVVLAQLFGTMMDLPKNFPMWVRDIKQLCSALGNPKLPEKQKGEHNALHDARWNKRAHEYLISLCGV
jgi:3' exoribonuclease, RNase T-like